MVKTPKIFVLFLVFSMYFENVFDIFVTSSKNCFFFIACLHESNMLMNNWLNALPLSKTFSKQIYKQRKNNQDPSCSPSANLVSTPYSSVKIKQPLPLRSSVHAPSSMATDTRAPLCLYRDKSLSTAEPNIPPSTKNAAVSYAKPDCVKTLVENPTQEVTMICVLMRLFARIE